MNRGEASPQLLVRGGPLPHLYFALGGDLFLSPFADSVSLRRYTSFGTEKLYPTAAGRLFPLEQWKFILKLAPRIAAALEKSGQDYLFQTPYSFEVAVRSAGGARATRKVAFLQQNRPDLEIGWEQFQKLVEKGKEFLRRPFPLASPQAKNKTKFTPTVTIVLDEDCKPVEERREMEEEKEQEVPSVLSAPSTPPSSQPEPTPGPSKKRKRGTDGGWTAPTIIRRRGGGKQQQKQQQEAQQQTGQTTKKKRKPSPKVVRPLTVPLPPKPVAEIPPKLLLSTEEAMPPPGTLTPPHVGSLEDDGLEWIPTPAEPQSNPFSYLDDDDDDGEPQDAQRFLPRTSSSPSLIAQSVENEEDDEEEDDADEGDNPR